MGAGIWRSVTLKPAAVFMIRLEETASLIAALPPKKNVAARLVISLIRTYSLPPALINDHAKGH